MSITIPTTEPTEIKAGDTVKWTRSLPDYLPPTWTLTYALRGLAGDIDISASDNGDGTHLVNEAPATTAGWKPGIYKWEAVVADGSDEYTVDEGTIEVKQRLSSIDGAHDGRSHAKKVLDAVEAVLEGRASQDQMSYTIAGRSLARTPLMDLRALRKEYRAEYVQEQRKERRDNDEGTGAKVLVKFV